MDKKVEVINIYDFQQRAYDEAGYEDSIPFDEQRRCLMRANEMHLQAIIEKLKQGCDVVAEQTFFKAKRRIAYIDVIRKEVDARIEVYVMCPSDERWEENIRIRGVERSPESYRRDREQLEFPNIIEGFDAIYEVSDKGVTQRNDPPAGEEVLVQARKELADEMEEIRREDGEKAQKKELLDSMNTRPFWHYCEVCGKKEYLTAEEAFHNGWDYPPNMGMFGVLSPRTCGNCAMQKTLWWKVQRSGVPFVIRDSLSPEELATWERIRNEPDSLLE